MAHAALRITSRTAQQFMTVALPPKIPKHPVLDLLSAILEQAISDLTLRGTDTANIIARNAAHWIFASSDEDWLCSFESICELRNANPAAVREQIRRDHGPVLRYLGY